MKKRAWCKSVANRIKNQLLFGSKLFVAGIILFVLFVAIFMQKGQLCRYSFISLTKQTLVYENRR